MDTRTRWFIVLGSLGALLGPATYDLARLSIQQYRLDRQLGALKTERDRLASLEQRLRHDPAYVEGLIRTTFKVSKPGEYVVPLDAASFHDRNR